MEANNNNNSGSSSVNSIETIRVFLATLQSYLTQSEMLSLRAVNKTWRDAHDSLHNPLIGKILNNIPKNSLTYRIFLAIRNDDTEILNQYIPVFRQLICTYYLNNFLKAFIECKIVLSLRKSSSIIHELLLLTKNLAENNITKESEIIEEIRGELTALFNEIQEING